MPTLSEVIEDEITSYMEDFEFYEITDGFFVNRYENGNIFIEFNVWWSEPSSFGQRKSNNFEDNLDSVEFIPTEETERRLEKILDEGREIMNNIKESGSGTPVRGPSLHKLDSRAPMVLSLDFSINTNIESPRFTKLCNLIYNADQSPLSNYSKIEEIRVDSPEYIPDEKDRTPNYTILYSTQKPHEMWNDFSTIEEYAEEVANNKDDVEVKEFLSRDSYTSHFHINGITPCNSMIREICRDIKVLIENHIPQSGEISVSRLKIDDENNLEASLSYYRVTEDPSDRSSRR